MKYYEKAWYIGHHVHENRKLNLLLTVICSFICELTRHWDVLLVYTTTLDVRLFPITIYNSP